MLLLTAVFCSPGAAACWGVAAGFADFDSAQSRWEAPFLAQRGIDCMFLNMRGVNYNWPNWTDVQDRWTDAGARTFWELPTTLPECERILGFVPGTYEVDDRAVMPDGSRAYFGSDPGLGSLFGAKFVQETRRVARAMASRLYSASGFQITRQIDLGSGSYDAEALASWRTFLAAFAGDNSPDDDSNRDTVTFNSAFGTSYASWDQVAQFGANELTDARKRQLVDIWLASSYADYVDGTCAAVEQVRRGLLLGPRLSTAVRGTVDASILASRPRVSVLYCDSPDSLPTLESAAAAFGKRVFANALPLVPGDYAASRQRVLRVLPYVSGACFDYAGLVAERDGTLPTNTGVSGEPRPYGQEPEAVAAPVKALDPAFQALPELAPFAGKLRIARAEALWIVPGERVEKDVSRIVDAAWVSEVQMALDPGCVDLSRFKVVIYLSPAPSISTAIMQKLFDYALAGGTVIVDGYNIASGPALLGRDNSHFWWQDLKLEREKFGDGTTVVEYAGRKWEFPFVAPHIASTSNRIKTEWGVRDSTGAAYPFLLIRAIGEKGKWVFVNLPGFGSQFGLLKAVVREQTGVTLPDVSKPRIYYGDNCLLAIGGAEDTEVTAAWPQSPAVALDISTGEVGISEPGARELKLGTVKAGEARLWVVKPYGKPVVMYADGTADYAGSVVDGEYAGNVLRFAFAQRAFVSCPERPRSVKVDGETAKYKYDPEKHLLTVERAGKPAAAEVEYGRQMAKTYKITENDSDIILLLNLQGLVNRDGARLFLDTEGRSDWGPADRRWMQVYSKRKGIDFEPVESFDDLVSEFVGMIDGLVVYDPTLDASRYVALTLAGLTNCLAVSTDQIKGTVAKLAIKEDLRGRFTTGVDAYEWALKNLRPRCSNTITYSAGQTHDDVNLGHDNGIILALDYAIAHKAFVFNLSPCPEPATYDYEKEKVKGHPEDAAMMDRIFDTYKAPAKVYGWNEPEWPFTSRISKHGHMLMCGRGSNLSFHQHVPAGVESAELSVERGEAPRFPHFEQKAATSSVATQVEDKYYMAFMTNEGDTPRVITTFFFGAWENPERGDVPINWGISPTLICDFPAIAEYYYSTATPNDYFYAGVSGTGYAFIDQLPDVSVFARYGKPRFEAADIDIVDAWDEFEFHPQLYETYAKEAGIRLFTLLPRGESEPKLLPGGVPVIVPHAKVHYKETGFDARIQNIEAITKERKPPYLIPLYGGVNHNACAAYKKIAEALDPEKFEFVTLAKMAELAKALGE